VDSNGDVVERYDYDPWGKRDRYHANASG